VIAASNSRLWTENDPRERWLTAGKVQNLRVAVERLNGIEVAAGEVFSFWKQIGRTSRLRGFVMGRELREGCLVPSVGGGLCQLSNALYDAALKANFEIVERHAHSMTIDGSLAETGRDATVFWNYVDLRFKSHEPFFIDAKLDGENLSVSIRGERSLDERRREVVRRTIVSIQPNSCVTCGVNECHHSVRVVTQEEFGRTAYLVDEFSPEFDRYIQSKRKDGDSLMVPIDGGRFRRPNYAWSRNGFERFDQSLYVTAARSYSSRKLASQGAARQLNLLDTYEKLAKSYARRLRYEDLHLVVQQNLLPFLWRDGVLGGRTFDVLMTALPMYAIQERLDTAYKLHPESRTLADFRADERLICAEREALARARRVITAHTAIAELFDEKADLLDWEAPVSSAVIRTRRERIGTGKPLVVFPAATVGRKGCYELRDALTGLDVKLLILGPCIESEDFWSGIALEVDAANWLGRADVVVLPAFVEHKPRRLIEANAAGIPVIASDACGVGNVIGIETVPAADVGELRSKIERSLSVNQARTIPDYATV
jgi:hypothetical protein